MKSIRPARTTQSLQPVLFFLFIFAWLAGSSSAMAGKRTAVRITDGKDVYTGCIVAKTPHGYLLMDGQGRLQELNPRTFKQVQKLPTPFRPERSSGFRRELIREFGREYEVQGTTHYLVCAPKGSAKNYARLFEDIYRDVDKFYRTRGFRVSAPSMPLVAIVFGTEKEFMDYCRTDNVPPKKGLMGYYSLMTNRVALFETRSGFRTSDFNPDPGTGDARRPAVPSSVAALAVAGGRTASTIIHETTHQVSYNLGIHSRLGGTPQWLVEGLATALEPDGMRLNRSAGERVNQERRDWFENRYLPKRPAGSIAQLIASDQPFQHNTLDAYSESWALTYFLLDTSTRRRAFSKYLQRIARRDSGSPYPEEQRLADFQAEFGDISRLEVQFLRFMEEL